MRAAMPVEAPALRLTSATAKSDATNSLFARCPLPRTAQVLRLFPVQKTPLKCDFWSKPGDCSTMYNKVAL